MVLNRNRPPYVLSKRVKVHRAKQLSDQLSALSGEDLRLLRRFAKDPREPGIQQILAKPLLAEYTIQELSVALAMLSGVSEISLPHILPTAGTVQITPHGSSSRSSFPDKLSLINNDNWLMPSRLNPHIARKLLAMPEDAFHWLANNIGNPSDPRSRFIIIRYHLYKYRREDLAATLATIIRLNRREQRTTRKSSTQRLSFSTPRFH
ncbi:MAG: hypothetical protein ACFFD8_04900 [Candidatus Thorarchaeota archaeon]